MSTGRDRGHGGPGRGHKGPINPPAADSPSLELQSPHLPRRSRSSRPPGPPSGPPPAPGLGPAPPGPSQPPTTCYRYCESIGELTTCQLCGIQGGWHQRDPAAAQLEEKEREMKHAQPGGGAAEAAEAARRLAKEERDDEAKIISTMEKTFSSKDKWGSVENETATKFIERIERELHLCSKVIPKEQWYRVFPYVIPTNMEEVSTWTNKHIVDKELSWTQASKEFIERYTPSDESRILTERYLNIRQRQNETCREFGNRFQTLAMDQPQVNLDAPLVIQHYLSRIHKNVREKVFHQIRSEKVSKPTYEIKTLKEAIRVAELMEDSAGGDHSHGTGGRDGGDKQTNKSSSNKQSSSFHKTQAHKHSDGSKYCTHHNTSSHNTEDCWVRNGGNPSGTSPNTIKTTTASRPPLGPSRSPSQTGAGTRFQGTCHRCGRLGHKEAECRARTMVDGSVIGGTDKQSSSSSSSSSVASSAGQPPNTNAKSTSSSTTTVTTTSGSGKRSSTTAHTRRGKRVHIGGQQDGHS